MDIFNQVIVCERNHNYGVDGPEWLPGTRHDVKRLMIRPSPQTGRIYLAERLTNDEEHDDKPFFEFNGYVVGPLEVDEYGITFIAYTNQYSNAQRRVVITRRGAYG